MQTKQENSAGNEPGVCGAVVTLGACQRVLQAVARVREQVVAEFRHLQSTHEHGLQLALNEAEGLAWQTGYPHLLFPVLAAEKAAQTEAWALRQAHVRRGLPLASLAA